MNSFYVICDRATAELSRRAKIYETVIEHFAVLFVEKLLLEIKKKATQKLKETYKDDIESSNFEDMNGTTCDAPLINPLWTILRL
ncbi:hypothetical protein TNCV_4200031 [Trichonephila clavipes]|uniref:Uncharacterized protein n=1 Tax=Trichonephila clavipes TaxID=2585209 RepID=A0A8X6WBT7_TRICX|nr:hypothetical protein TNCV_4200031 [Trichonephila clavipes]